MKFDKDFPELKDKHYREGEHDLGIHNEGVIDVIPKEFVEEFCLSKQRVKEAIDYYDKNGVGDAKHFIGWLKKELGIE